MSGTLYVWAQQIELPAIETQTEVTVQSGTGTPAFLAINDVSPYYGYGSEVLIEINSAAQTTPIQFGFSSNGSVSGVGEFFDVGDAGLEQIISTYYRSFHTNNSLSAGQVATPIARFTDNPNDVFIGEPFTIVNEATAVEGVTLAPYWIIDEHIGPNQILLETGSDVPLNNSVPQILVFTTLDIAPSLTGTYEYVEGSISIAGTLAASEAPSTCSSEFGDLYCYSFLNSNHYGSLTIPGTLSATLSSGDTLTFKSSTS